MSAAHRVFFGLVLVLLSGALAYGVYAEEDPQPVPPADPPAPAGGPEPAAGPPQLGNRVTENGQRVGREQMWPAPTAEDWAKPVLITFQRTWDDAVAVSKETGKPILICINMDGEIASEHYAGVRYRQPEIAELYEPYVCVHRLRLPPQPARLRRRGAPHPLPALRQRDLRRAHLDRAGHLREVLRREAHRAAPHRGRPRGEGGLRRLLRQRHRLGVRRDPRGTGRPSAAEARDRPRATARSWSASRAATPTTGAPSRPPTRRATRNSSRLCSRQPSSTATPPSSTSCAWRSSGWTST